MNRNLTLLSVSLALTFAASCGKKDKDTGGAATADKAVDSDDKKAPTLVINEADWVVKDLKAVSPMVNISMKVPKDAKLEKNGNGGVDVTVADFYAITVNEPAVSGIPEAMKDDKSLTIDNKDSYINGKVLTEEPNGFVYTMQMKTEANGHTYQPETHFAVYLDKDGAVYSIRDEKPLSAFDTPGSAYTEAMAKQVYAIVKASAKVN